MKNTKRKGFTIVELVIVLAVIAILAAVLIPTFASLINKANQSADIQAVHQMNTTLAVDGAVTPTSITGLYDALEEAGMTAKDYTPLYSNRCFYWVKSLNQVIYYDREADKVVFPENVTETKGWYALDGSFDTSKATITELPTESNNIYTFTISSAADFVKAAELVLKSQSSFSSKTIELKLSNDIDLQGADVNFTSGNTSVVNNLNVKILSNDNTSKTITGLYISDKHGASGHDSNGKANNNYGHSLFNQVNDLTVENITIKDSAVGGYGTSQGAFFAGKIYGTAKYTNVTVEGCEVQGEKKVGVLAGYLVGTSEVSFKNVTIKNCNVSTLQGEAGIAFGVYTDLYKIESTKSPFSVENFNIIDSTVSVYSNEVLTATSDGKEYNVVKYDEDGNMEYRMATAFVGLIGNKQSKETHTLTINGVENSAVDIKLYDSITEVDKLTDVKGTKSSN